MPLEIGDTFFVRVSANLSELDRISRIVQDFGKKHHLSQKITFELNLALDELITNVITYGYRDRKGTDHSIGVTLTIEPGIVTVFLEDNGCPFNPLDAARPELDGDYEHREIGGLGIHLVRSLMDELEYERQEDKNHLRMTKRF